MVYDRTPNIAHVAFDIEHKQSNLENTSVPSTKAGTQSVTCLKMHSAKAEGKEYTLIGDYRNMQRTTKFTVNSLSEADILSDSKLKAC